GGGGGVLGEVRDLRERRDAAVHLLGREDGVQVGVQGRFGGLGGAVQPRGPVGAPQVHHDDVARVAPPALPRVGGVLGVGGAGADVGDDEERIGRGPGGAR